MPASMRKYLQDTKNGVALVAGSFPTVLVCQDMLLQTVHKYFQLDMPKVFPFSHHHPCSSEIPILSLAWLELWSVAKVEIKHLRCIRWFPYTKYKKTQDLQKNWPQWLKTFVQPSFLRTASLENLATIKPLQAAKFQVLVDTREQLDGAGDQARSSPDQPFHSGSAPL